MAAARSSIVFVELETADTGESKTTWGHNARRYLTFRREWAEDAKGNKTSVRESTIENWFLDVSPPPRYRPNSVLTTTFMLAAANSQPLVGITRKGVKPSGLLISETSPHSLIEVTSLSESPLDPKLFEVPANYRHVIKPIPGKPLPWDQQLLYYWQQIEDWFSGPFS